MWIHNSSFKNGFFDTKISSHVINFLLFINLIYERSIMTGPFVNLTSAFQNHMLNGWPDKPPSFSCLGCWIVVITKDALRSCHTILFSGGVSLPFFSFSLSYLLRYPECLLEDHDNFKPWLEYTEFIPANIGSSFWNSEALPLREFIVFGASRKDRIQENITMNQGGIFLENKYISFMY